MVPPVTALFADGGVIKKNPSPHGGMWAYCLVAGGEFVRGESGLVTPVDVGLPTVSNNYTELRALVEGMSVLPDGWDGDVLTDSFVALRTVEKCLLKPARPDWVPEPLWDRLRAQRARLGDFRLVLLGGHPNQKELAAGIRADGKRVSRWNVWCDEACGTVAAKHLAEARPPEPLNPGD